MIAAAMMRRMLTFADQMESANFVKICEKGKGEVNVQKAKLWAGISILLVVSMSASVFKVAEARYIHSTYNYSPSRFDDQQLAAASREPIDYRQQLSRRQDNEGETDDDEDDDQKPAASYRNQDDNGGESGNSNDNYGDNEPDGPYDETPVEQEGQADLERFFDDHLGASDRDGMDKENLPTNLVSLLSDPPQLVDLNGNSMRLSVKPITQMANRPTSSLTAVPLVPVLNPIVQARERVADEHGNNDPLSSLPTIQTSFTRLPDEKMIITHQVTRKAPNNYDRRPPPRPLKFLTDDNERQFTGSSSVIQNANPGGTASGHMVALVDSGQFPSSFTSEQQQQRQQLGLRISPTESLATAPARYSSQAANDIAPKAGSSNNEIVATENDEFDRVYLTNETNKPFKIDALGGYDPEEDFLDAAKELEVVASDEIGTRTPAGVGKNRNLKRRSEQRDNQQSSASGGDDRADVNRGPNGQHGQASSEEGRAPLFGREISFNDPDTDMMYEDASETDEVTFGQDDPYQTDLEAEMRQQEYEKLLARSGQHPNHQPTASDSLNVVVDNGPKGEANQVDSNDDEDIDEDVDNDYKPELHQRQQESMAAAAATRNRWKGRSQPDADEDGSWVNDGVDEMDIPSQSHQNSVLDKAEQRDEAAKRAAADEAAGENSNQGSDGGSAESGPTNDGGEESVRMPNADYLKNDSVDDDSGYAA